MKKLIVLFALVLNACASSKPITKECYMQRRWIQYPIHLRFDKNLKQRDVVIAAIDYWNNISVDKDLFIVVEDGVTGSYDEEDRMNVISTVPEIPKSKDGTITLANTNYWYSGIAMFEADVKINDKYSGLVDVSVMIHELGHVLGLGHNENNEDSFMYPYAGNYKTLDAEDIEKLQCGGVWVKL